MSKTTDLVEDIQSLSRYREVSCPRCGEQLRVYTLTIYASCPKCGEERKYRSFGATGTETEDVIDAVLAWIGTGETFKAAMRRHNEIVAEAD